MRLFERLVSLFEFSALHDSFLSSNLFCFTKSCVFCGRVSMVAYRIGTLKSGLFGIWLLLVTEITNELISLASELHWVIILSTSLGIKMSASLCWSSCWVWNVSSPCDFSWIISVSQWALVSTITSTRSLIFRLIFWWENLESALILVNNFSLIILKIYIKFLGLSF